jgi:hypothetical protein
MRDRLVGVMQHRALQCRRAGGLLGLTLDGLQLQATTLRADWGSTAGLPEIVGTDRLDGGRAQTA